MLGTHRCISNNRSNHSRCCVMNKETNYWKTAEQMNGRLAMMGFFAAVINYGLTGWIIPGIV
nr:chlorophyll a/b-binding protein [Prochlorococcus marinus]